MVTKSKESDIKYVTILAEKVVKPLIRSILAVEEKSKQSNFTKGVKCGTCEKTFQTLRGLKGHNTKVHKEGCKTENEDINTEILWNEENNSDEDSEAETIAEEIEVEKRYYYF